MISFFKGIYYQMLNIYKKKGSVCMFMKPVVSDNFVSVGYNALSKILRIEFKHGLYEYYNVPEHVYQNLLNSKSKEKYYGRFIKNVYPSTKIIIRLVRFPAQVKSFYLKLF